MATERWRYRLRCPQCNRVGAAEVTELDGLAYLSAKERGDQHQWVDLSDGFVVEDQAGAILDAVCVACAVRAEVAETDDWQRADAALQPDRSTSG